MTEKEAQTKLLNLSSVIDLLPSSKQVKEQFWYKKDWEEDDKLYPIAKREGAFYVINTVLNKLGKGISNNL